MAALRRIADSSKLCQFCVKNRIMAVTSLDAASHAAGAILQPILTADLALLLTKPFGDRLAFSELTETGTVDAYLRGLWNDAAGFEHRF